LRRDEDEEGGNSGEARRGHGLLVTGHCSPDAVTT